MTIWLRIAMAGVVLVGLSGCGRRGELEPAIDASAPKAAQPAEAATQTPSPGVSGAAIFAHRPKKVPIPVPQGPFILDPIL
ncbi:MAG: hypothetical protein KGQ46_05485 [Hyphomicrobiales bacterium]|nr:hypothetical protein [Hyphomicrobiales bacterium]MDE2115482.1 hypothetical protein [Hyphomicrobiales bacterium]